MATMSASISITRSSLEEMLDSLCKRDGHTRDMPPVLPTRPVSKGRRPSSRRPLPMSPKVAGDPLEHFSNCIDKPEQSKSGKDEDVGVRSGIFGSKRLKKAPLVESPYIRLPELENSKRMDDAGDSDSTAGPSPSADALNGGFACGDTAGYVLRKKLRVWCSLPSGEWKLGKIQSITDDDADVLLTDGKVLTVRTENLLPANPDILDGVNDLIQLSYLNEPSVLHNLQHRYSQDTIYTKAGPVLVAVNPFKEVPIYGNGFLTAYREKTLDAPHLYIIADNAFNEMMNDGVNQSIIISGESGAGKTETAKVAMQYLASLGGGSGIESEVLQTNCILEAFGNAKTSRNDNSSRFGKLIEIHFSRAGKICGAKIQTFLLEKSRVVKRAKGERSYHIFYQLCAGAPPTLRERLHLKKAENYEYLKQSECMIIDNVDDAKRFHVLLEALDIIQIHKEDQENAFAMLAAVLWLGNISFKIIDNENHVEVVPDEGVTIAAGLLGCNNKSLVLALSTRKIKAGKENIVQRLTLTQAVDTRDALAKSVYSSLFDWLVEQVNKSLEVGKSCTGRSISILDIYGFESFPKNSFEQLCINYANERLQQHFNRHLFKLEQEEYAQDGIDWTKVDFVDNAECLSLFEKKPIGLLSLLDEESTFPRATDLTFANKLKQHLNGYPCFKGGRGGAFSVCHYAGEVTYDTSGFLEKNRDPLHSDSIQLLLSSDQELPKLFAYNILNPSQKPFNASKVPKMPDSQKQSVGTKFKGQLFKLMQSLESTTPHFVRCIKPNSKQLPGIYEQDLVLQQLRCCGVLEIVRIARSGYPTRMTHQQFAERYGCLLLENVASQDPLSVSVAILQHFGVLPDMYQVGYTKLFFRTGQIASLEDSRNRAIHGILRVQKCYRGIRAWRYYQELRSGAIMLQSFVRYQGVRNKFELTIKRRAIIIIQKYAKRRVAQKAYEGRRKAAICLQCVIRGWLARKQFEILISLDLLKKKHLSAHKQDNHIMGVKDHERQYPPVHFTVLAELQKRVLKAEATVRQKEEENSALLLQLKQYEIKWADYEAKMKSMEEMWQRQMAALQSSLAAAKKSLPPDDVNGNGVHINGRQDISPLPAGKVDVSPPPVLYYDSEDTLSLGTRTPEVTPMKPARPSESAPGRVADSSHIAVTHLVKEFDRHKEVFEDDVQFLVEVKTYSSVFDVSPDEELRKLKFRFRTWKKEYKARLRETKLMLHKLGFGEAEKFRKKWWGKISTRGS